MGWASTTRKAKVDEFFIPTFELAPIDWTRLVSLDFETYYDADYTLNKLSTSEYIRDPRFEVLMCGIKIGNRPTKVVPGNKVRAELAKINWATHTLLCHNTQFDGFILSHHYGIKPSFTYCSLSMARGLFSNDIGAGLDEVSLYLGGKGKIAGGVEDMKGIHFKELFANKPLWKRSTAYCAQDVDEMLGIFKSMHPRYPRDEIELIHLTNRMFNEPVLKVNIPRVQKELERELAEREALLLNVINPRDYDAEIKLILKTKVERALESKERDMLIAKRVVGSNERFAALLRAEGIDPPVKISPAWIKKDADDRDDADKWAFAFAKDDLDFVTLPDNIEQLGVGLDLNKKADIRKLVARQARLRHLVDTRLAVKSTTNITRAERFLKAGANGMSLPCGYAYARAHTLRWGGNNKMNMQNLTRGGELRQSIEAPPGHVIGVADSGQIEARVNGMLWGQTDLLDAFRAADEWDKSKGVAHGNDRDAYCKFADIVYGREITTEDKMERFVGKVCVAGDTCVLTNHGVKSIVEVRSTDLLWDGLAWVRHDGLLHQGTKQVLRMHGFAATPDHEILTERGWQEWSVVLTDRSLFQSALSSATSPLSDGTITPPGTENLGVTAQFAAALAALKTWSMPAASKLVAALAAISAPKSQPLPNGTGPTNMLWPTTSTALVCSTGFRRRSLAARTPKTPRSNTMGSEAYQWLLNGATTVLRFSAMSRLCRDGMTQLWRWTGETPMAATSRVMSDSSPSVPTSRTNAASRISNNASAILSEITQTYDLANAGPNHRFTIITDVGPLIVHNCVLGLGFQMGAPKLQMTLAKGALGGPPVYFELDKCQIIISAYRRKNHRIANGWQICKNIIEDMAAGIEGSHGPISWAKETVYLPNGLTLRYPDLRKRTGDKGWDEWTYQAKDQRKKLYGGLLCENIVQALARIIIGEQMLAVDKHARVVMTTHDEIVTLIKKRAAELTMRRIFKIMRTPPKWWPGIPLNVEGGFAENYSK